MQGMSLPVTIFLPGTITGDHALTFIAPRDLQLVAVSGVQSSSAGSGAAQVKVGTAADDDAYMEHKVVGVSGAPIERSRADFVGGQNPSIPKGTAVRITVTNGATNSDNVGVVVTFTE